MGIFSMQHEIQAQRMSFATALTTTTSFAAISAAYLPGPSVHEEDRQRGMVDYRLGDSAEHKFARARMSKASKHQQIRLQVRCELQQLGCCGA